MNVRTFRKAFLLSSGDVHLYHIQLDKSVSLLGYIILNNCSVGYLELLRKSCKEGRICISESHLHLKGMFNFH